MRDLDADFIFICKPSSHKRLFEVLHEDFMHPSDWRRDRNRQRQVEQQRYRWMRGLPVRDGAEAVQGTWVEFEIKRRGQRTYYNTFFTSLEVTAENVAAIARLGRARWMIENETFNCLTCQGYNFKRNFGHCRQGLANLLASFNLFAFALHTLLDCVRGLWRQCRAKAGTCRYFFAELRVLTEFICWPDWTALLSTASGHPRRLAALGAACAGASPAHRSPAARPTAHLHAANLELLAIVASIARLGLIRNSRPSLNATTLRAG